MISQSKECGAESDIFFCSGPDPGYVSIKNEKRLAFYLYCNPIQRRELTNLVLIAEKGIEAV
jgi:hypothetical protein